MVVDKCSLATGFAQSAVRRLQNCRSNQSLINLCIADLAIAPDDQIVLVDLWTDRNDKCTQATGNVPNAEQLSLNSHSCQTAFLRFIAETAIKHEEIIENKDNFSWTKISLFELFKKPWATGVFCFVPKNYWSIENKVQSRTFSDLFIYSPSNDTFEPPHFLLSCTVILVGA